jgi:HEAT repeat protein
LRCQYARALPALLRAYWQRKQVVRDAIFTAVARIGAGGDSGALPLEDVGLEAGKIDYRALVRSLGMPGPIPALDTAVLRGRAGDVGQGILDALANTGRRDTVVRVLHDLDAGDGFELGAFTSGQVATSAATEVLHAVAHQIAPRVDALCESKDPEVRTLALDVLAKLGDPRAPERAAKALSDDAPSVRLAALVSVRRYLVIAGASAPAAELAGPVAGRLQAPTYQERAAAAETLGWIPATGTAVLTAALSDPDGFVRESAARALGRLRHGDAIPALLETTKDEVAEVRLAAVQAVVPMGDPRARARLAELARDDADPRVRAAAASH